jgi:hypothetical protein
MSAAWDRQLTPAEVALLAAWYAKRYGYPK